MQEGKNAHEITIFVNNQEFKVTQREMIGAEIKALANVPVDYELFRLEGNNSISIGNEERVHLHEKEQFRAIPSGTFGTYAFAAKTC